eukprot:scaffold177080_cov33-Prasinocladus_malaysianus.AAC.1
MPAASMLSQNLQNFQMAASSSSNACVCVPGAAADSCPVKLICITPSDCCRVLVLHLRVAGYQPSQQLVMAGSSCYISQTLGPAPHLTQEPFEKVNLPGQRHGLAQLVAPCHTKIEPARFKGRSTCAVE